MTFTGWVADPRAFLAGVDVFVLSSRSEALPLAMLEAMAEGLPCVSTDVGDVTARLGGAVEVVPVEDAPALADAVQGLLADPDRAAALGRAARERVVASHDAASMVAATYAVLRQVAGRLG